jgi:hypothetical protein|nr:MAG TPA: hypothetical protein [Caudoviricetes sp.]
MTTYYMSENNGGFRKAEKLNAETLTAAKREATRKQVFQGTRVAIGIKLNENGFIKEAISVKKDRIWNDVK